MELRWPSEIELPSYVRAFEQNWSPNTIDTRAGQLELEAIRRDRIAFLTPLVGLEARGPTIHLPDGTVAFRIPGYRKWMCDGEFCGSIGLRWIEVTTDVDNVASRGVIGAAGGALVECFTYPPGYGKGQGLRYGIDVPVVV